MVAREGFEPTTSGLWARRATRLLYLAIRKKHLNQDMAEELGFEPSRHLHDLPVFKTGPYNHLGIPPLVDPEGLEPSTGRLWADSSNRLS